MAKSATAGEMRTRIRILKPQKHPDAKAYKNPKYVNIYDDDRVLRCKWVSAFGTEAIQAHSLGLSDPATVTMRYDPRVTGDCILEKLPPAGSGAPPLRYKIISAPNDVEGAHRYLEFKVTRKGAAL